MAADGKLHVVMFPWLAFGHIIPFLELSKFIAQNGHKVSFVSTKRNIDRLPSLPPNLSSLITLVRLTLPCVDGLPEHAEATMDVLKDDVLKKAFDGLEPELTRFLETESPDWIIYDFASYWLPCVAANLGISRAFLSIVNAMFLAFVAPSSQAMINGSDGRKSVEDFMVPPKWIPFPTEVCHSLYEVNWILGTRTENASGVSDRYRAGMTMMGSDAIFVRQALEFEPEWLNLLEALHHKPVIPVGLMPPSTQDTIEDGKNETWLSINNWLESQRSVVYVALGSEITLCQGQVTELALGLEVSGLPFFWAFRKLGGSSSTESDSVELPDGFLERTKSRGLVWTSWAPQLKILGHESVGGFLTHCGWGSIVEGLMFGHPLIMLPFVLDQGLNARLLAGKGVGIQVPRNEVDGSFTRNSIAEALRLVTVEDEGRVYKAKAKEMSTIFGDRDLQNRYIKNFIEYLETKTR